MPFDWKQYAEIAKHLQDRADLPREAALRSAVSRAYYSAFCHARNYARDWLNFQPRYTPDDHGRVRAHFASKRRQPVSNKLGQLRQWRNDCDYLDQLDLDLLLVVRTALADLDYILSGLSTPKTPNHPQK